MSQESQEQPQEERRRRAGRPPRLGPHELAVLRGVALEHPGDSMDELRRRLAEVTGQAVCAATVRKGLRAVGLLRVRPQQAKDVPTESKAPSSPSSHTATYGYRDDHRDAGDRTRYPSNLRDAEWSLVEDLFTTSGRGKPPQYERRHVVDAICYVVRSGCSWRMLPRSFPPWIDVYKTFRRWSDAGKFEAMHDRLRAMWREREGRKPEPTAAVLDSQSVKTSPQGGIKGFDAGKKVKGRKRHILVDTLGLLLAVFVQPASVQDRDGAAPVVERGCAKYPSLQTIFVDGGYGGQCAETLRKRHGLNVEVVRHPANRSVGRLHDQQLPLFEAPSGFVVLRKRWVVERTHAWNERPRRLAKDHDRLLSVSSSWLWLTEARILVRRLTAAAA